MAGHNGKAGERRATAQANANGTRGVARVASPLGVCRSVQANAARLHRAGTVRRCPPEGKHMSARLLCVGANC